MHLFLDRLLSMENELIKTGNEHLTPGLVGIYPGILRRFSAIGLPNDDST